MTPPRPCYTVLSHPARCRIRRLLILRRGPGPLEQHLRQTGIRTPWCPLKGFGSRTMHAALKTTHLSGSGRRLNEQRVCQASSSRVKCNIIGIVLLQHKMATRLRGRNNEAEER
jgi:hypothetical protein